MTNMFQIDTAEGIHRKLFMDGFQGLRDVLAQRAELPHELRSRLRPWVINDTYFIGNGLWAPDEVGVRE